MRSCGRVQPREMTSHSGFTLIEILIVVIVLGILAMVALPAYQDSVRKGQRSDGKVTLLDVAGRMEQYILDHGRYTYDMRNLGYDADPMVSAEGHYSVDAAACTGGDETSCYVLTATPRSTSPLVDDADCTTLILSYTGARSATPAGSNRCWN